MPMKWIHVPSGRLNTRDLGSTGLLLELRAARKPDSKVALLEAPYSLQYAKIPTIVIPVRDTLIQNPIRST